MLLCVAYSVFELISDSHYGAGLKQINPRIVHATFGITILGIGFGAFVSLPPPS